MNAITELSAEDFIRKVLVKETEKLVNQGLYQFSFVIMSQAIETLGSFLDAKPLKARDQSKRRFSHAVNKLMPVKYAKLNNNHLLYNQLRASLAHTFTASRQIILSSRSNKQYGDKHLEKTDEKLILIAEDFYDDFKKACLRLIEAMEKGIIPEKKINTDFYYTFN